MSRLYSIFPYISMANPGRASLDTHLPSLDTHLPSHDTHLPSLHTHPIKKMLDFQWNSYRENSSVLSRSQAFCPFSKIFILSKVISILYIPAQRWVSSDGRWVSSDDRWVSSDGRWVSCDGRWVSSDGRGVSSDALPGFAILYDFFYIIAGFLYCFNRWETDS